jgi:serine/threonine protein kinase
VYEVHGSNKLGKGSYGSVYLATHRLTGDERAVKVMNVDRVTSYYLRKLHTEISILKCVDHPNIVRLQDVFFGKRSVYLVTDLCRGGELFELLNAGKNEGFVFREDRASQLMRDMLSAVHYLHSKVLLPSLSSTPVGTPPLAPSVATDNAFYSFHPQGILHRDLKLENFLFEEKNCNSPLVLIDFGLSKHFDPDDKLTHRGMLSAAWLTSSLECREGGNTARQIYRSGRLKTIQQFLRHLFFDDSILHIQHYAPLSFPVLSCPSSRQLLLHCA